MRTDCCTVNGLDKAFDQTQANRDVEEYTTTGLDETAQMLLDFFREKGLSGMTLLEIGCGVGSLLLELLKTGAEKGMGVDASPPYIQAAKGLAEKLQPRPAVEYLVMDFALQPDEVEEADIVLMHRVVCCYPQMVELVVPAAQHALKFLALSYPRDLWWVRLRIALENIFYRMLRREYRAFVHSPAQIQTTIIAQGFQPVRQDLSGEWHVDIYQRRG